MIKAKSTMLYQAFLLFLSNQSFFLCRLGAVKLGAVKVKQTPTESDDVASPETEFHDSVTLASTTEASSGARGTLPGVRLASTTTEASSGARRTLPSAPEEALQTHTERYHVQANDDPYAINASASTTTLTQPPESEIKVQNASQQQISVNLETLEVVPQLAVTYPRISSHEREDKTEVIEDQTLPYGFVDDSESRDLITSEISETDKIVPVTADPSRVEPVDLQSDRASIDTANADTPDPTTQAQLTNVTSTENPQSSLVAPPENSSENIEMPPHSNSEINADCSETRIETANTIKDSEVLPYASVGDVDIEGLTDAQSTELSTHDSSTNLTPQGGSSSDLITKSTSSDGTVTDTQVL